MRPGLTGIGSIVFRDEKELLSTCEGDPKDFYAQHISPYKGELELWYQDHLSLLTDLKLLFLTAWVVLFPKSTLHTRWFKDLPPAPAALHR